MADFLKNILANKTQAPTTVPPAGTAVNPATNPPVNPLANLNLGAKPAQAATTVGADLGGGSRLDFIRNGLKTASVGGRRNEIALGEAWYLLKSGKYSLTRKNKQRTEFSFICIRAIKDKEGLSPNMEGYTGAIVGSEYTTTLWHDNDYSMSGWLSAVRACMGWTKEKVKSLQKTEEGITLLLGLVEGLICLGTNGLTKTVCAYSNQVVLQMRSEIKRDTAKIGGEEAVSKVTGQPITVEYRNTYWDNRIPFAEIQTAKIPGEILLKAFGSEEAVGQAVETEKQLDALG